MRYDFLSPASRESPDTDERTDILESLVLAADFAFRATTLVLFHWENEHFTLRLLANRKLNSTSGKHDAATDYFVTSSD